MAQVKKTENVDFTIQDILDFLRQDELDYPAAAARFGKEALPFLSDLVKGSDENLAIKAAYLVGYIDGEASDEILKNAATTGIAPVRIAAAFGAQKRAPKAAEAILQHSLDDSDPSVVKFALRSASAMKLGDKLKIQIDKISKSFLDEGIQLAAKDVLKKLK